MVASIKAYQAFQKASQATGGKIDIAVNGGADKTNGGPSFSEVLGQNVKGVIDDAKNTEKMIHDYTLGKVQIENIALPVREFMLEFEGGVSITKGATESIKTVMQIQV